VHDPNQDIRIKGKKLKSNNLKHRMMERNTEREREILCWWSFSRGQCNAIYCEQLYTPSTQRQMLWYINIQHIITLCALEYLILMNYLVKYFC